MALSRVKTWGDEILTASDLNAEFNNILNNALSLISPLTANLAYGGFRATGLSLGSVSDPSAQFTGDTNTGVYSSTADTLDIACGGVRAASFATIASGVNYLQFVPGATGSGPVIDCQGSDSNIPLAIDTKGNGVVSVRAGGLNVTNFSTDAAAVNYMTVINAATGAGPTIDTEGTDAAVPLNLDTKSTGAIIFNTGGSERGRINAGPLNWGNTVTVGASSKGIVLDNNQRVSFLDSTASTSANFGLTGDSSDNLSLDVPATSDVFAMRWAGNAYIQYLSQNTAGAIQLIEASADFSAAPTNGVRIYAKDNGAGKTQLLAIFASGGAQQIAIEP